MCFVLYRSPIPSSHDCVSSSLPNAISFLARGERLKEATAEAKRVIAGYRDEKEAQFQEFIKSVRIWNIKWSCLCEAMWISGSVLCNKGHN